MRDQQYRPDIDGLRTIAVAGVILFHLGFSFLPGGFVGVDVFFVISGFLITRLIKEQVETGVFAYSRFYIRRIRRLLPAALFTIGISYFFSYLLLSADHFQDMSASSIAAIFSASNVWFWSQSGYFDTAAHLKPLLHTWSLSVEEQFYILWPASIVFFLSANNRKIVPIILGLAGLVSIYFSWAWVEHNPSTAFYLTPFRVYEFVIGALVVWLPSLKWRNTLVLEFILLIGLGLIAWSMIFFTENTPFPSFNALLPCLGAAMVIYAGSAPKLGYFLRNEIMVWAGLRSYSLYLVHWPIIVFYSYYTFSPLDQSDQIVILVSTVVTASLMYRFIEIPFRIRGVSSPVIKGSTFAIAAILLAIAIIPPSALSYYQNGWRWRIPSVDTVESEVNQNIDLRRNSWHKSLITTYTNAQDVGSRDPNAKTALIIGDSHAAHIRGAFDYIGKKYNVRTTLWYYVGCNPLFGTTHVFAAPDPREEGCRKQNIEWENHIKARKFDYIVLSSRWAWTVEPTDYGPYKILRQYLVNTNSPILTLDASRDVFRTHLHQTVTTSLESASEVILIAQSPNNGKSLDGCDDIPRYLINDDKVEERCRSISKDLVLQRQKFTNDLMRTEADKNSRVHVVLPTNYFCNINDSNCRTLFDGIKLFQDDTHYTVAGAKYLALQWEKDKDFPFGKK